MSIARAALGKAFSAAVMMTTILDLGGYGLSGPHGSSQVVTGVDGSEIMVSEVNVVLAGMPADASAAAPALRKWAIQALVNQQLELDQAQALKLDQAPAVLLQLELAHRQALANASLRQVLRNVSAPNDETARRYYAPHPDLFAQRKIYQLHELAARGDAKLRTRAQAEVSTGKSIDDIATTLNDKAVLAAETDQSLPAERISPELVPKLASVTSGKNLVVAGGGPVRMPQLVGSQTHPIDEAHAQPDNPPGLLNKSRKSAIMPAIKRLRAKASTQYLSSDAPTQTAATPALSSAAVNHRARLGSSDPPLRSHLPIIIS